MLHITLLHTYIHHFVYYPSVLKLVPFQSTLLHIMILILYYSNCVLSCYHRKLHYGLPHKNNWRKKYRRENRCQYESPSVANHHHKEHHREKSSVLNIISRQLSVKGAFQRTFTKLAVGNHHQQKNHLGRGGGNFST